MASSSTLLPTQRPAAFGSRVEGVKVDKTLINEVVMEYLIREGHTQAAKNFAREANLGLDWEKRDVDQMEERAAIRNCIHAGQIEEAIERINDLAPEVLDQHASLHFALLRLQLIELIRPAIANPDKHMLAALEFAEQNLAATAVTSPEYLRDLEDAMTLIICQPGKIHASVAHLLEPDLKRNVAKRVNEAILESSGGVRRNKLLELVKMREWSENIARGANCELPARLDIGLDPTKTDDDAVMNLEGNGHSENVAMT